MSDLDKAWMFVIVGLILLTLGVGGMLVQMAVDSWRAWRLQRAQDRLLELRLRQERMRHERYSAGA